ncbi:hypothetical protein [Hazenella coriacea]|uniref:Uncharacterized protein n=1 Tax=Hazenella coriacea TaxID=1179467 RepID=A0A4R3L0V9_9BACL|nr:hypothetical protein [Hazenella coriacea]TCS93151.1 hypothetical protein EDD58_10993 [Hazenella coriacea]
MKRRISNRHRPLKKIARKRQKKQNANRELLYWIRVYVKHLVEKEKETVQASIQNGARIGASSGLVNIIVQIPINLGDSTSLNKSNENSLTNTL